MPVLMKLTTKLNKKKLETYYCSSMITDIGSLKTFEIAKNPAFLYSITDNTGVFKIMLVSCFLFIFEDRNPET